MRRLATLLVLALPLSAAGQGLTEDAVASQTAGLPSRYPRGFMRGFSAGYLSGFEEGKARDKAGQTASRNVGALTWTHAGPPSGVAGSSEQTEIAAGRRAVDDQIVGLTKDYDDALNILRESAPHSAALEPTGSQLATRLTQRARWKVNPNKLIGGSD